MQDDEHLPQSADLGLIGKYLDGKYLIQSVLAESGMGVLYKAQQVSVERTVVIKIAYDSLLSTPNEIERFAVEAKALARVSHPNIVAIHDCGFIDLKLPYLVMEFVNGQNLADMVRIHGLPSTKVAARIMVQICRGLNEVHNAGIVHRDIKPENIILQNNIERPDWVKIVDFGIVYLRELENRRLTKRGCLVGTMEYVAPELLNDMLPDSRCDIYSLGVVIFELLTGVVPISADNLNTLIGKILMESAPSITTFRPDIVEGSIMERTISKCLEKNPKERFQTVLEVIEAVQPAMQ
ncbi:MAG: serine/threonine protein kinase [Candidatus Obscuribacterales bacterium]|nr:serine/threonine protein kinase [Candidatus Obscuribacterales bacterium]